MKPRAFSFILLMCSTSANAAVYLNGGSNNIDVIWTYSSVYIGYSQNISTHFMTDGQPKFLNYPRTEAVNIYAEAQTAMVANFTPDNQLDSIGVGITVSSHITGFAELNVAFNVEPTGSNAIMRAYFVQTGSSGGGGSFSLGPLAWDITSPEITADGVTLPQNGGNNNRISFRAYMPTTPSSVSGSIFLTFDRELTNADIESLSAIPEPSSFGLISAGILLAMTRRRRG